MLSIRLSRIGKKKQPSYRLIVLEKSKDPWGDYLENLGNYNPLTKPSTISFKEERIKYWLEKGAQPSPTVHNILVDKGIIKEEKIRVVKIKKKKREEIKAEKAKEEAKPPLKEEKTEEKKEEAKI